MTAGWRPWRGGAEPPCDPQAKVRFLVRAGDRSKAEDAEPVVAERLRWRHGRNAGDIVAWMPAG